NRRDGGDEKRVLRGRGQNENSVRTGGGWVGASWETRAPPDLDGPAARSAAGSAVVHVPVARDENHDPRSRPESSRPCQGFLFQRTPWGVSSRTIPLPRSSSRMASAALKSRVFLAALRAAMRASIHVSSTSGNSDEDSDGDFLESEEARPLAASLGMMPRMFPAISWRRPRAAVASAGERWPASRSTFVALTKEKRAPRAPAVFKSSSRESNTARCAADTRSAKSPPAASGAFTFKEISSSSFPFLPSRSLSRKSNDSSRSTADAAALSPSKVKLSFMRYGTEMRRYRIARGEKPFSRRSGSVKKFPLLFAIFSPSTRRCSAWSQKLTKGFPVAPSLCAISFSWCGKMLSTAPVWMSNVSPRYFIDMALHSRCHPGRPRPSSVVHVADSGSPSFATFQTAKSRTSSLSYSSSATRAPRFTAERSILESFP